MRLLLHVCCGTCVIGLLDSFKGQELSLFFYNPNIEPIEEYEKRLKGVREIAAKFDLGLIEGEYDNKLWHDKIEGLEKRPENGERCKVCFAMRLEKTGEVAAAKDFDMFGSSLSVNCWKDVGFINSKGREIASKNRLNFFDFGLSKEEIQKICYKEKELAREHNLYKQKYCGCLYGLQNQKQGRESQNRRDNH